MTGRAPRGGRHPRASSWLLAALVAGSLIGAGWLFLADGGDSGDGHSSPASDSPSANTTSNDDRVEGELTVPSEESVDPSDARRRGDVGRDRLPAPEDDAAQADAPAEPTTQMPELPALLTNLAGRRVALAPASAASTGTPRRLVKVGALRVPCSRPREAGRLAVELAVLDRVEGLLDRVDATVVRVDNEDHVVPCVDVRVARLESAELAVVLRADPGGKGRVFAGRNDAGGDARPRAASSSLAADLAGALRLGGIDAIGKPQRDLLGSVGAIDRPRGGHIVLLELGGLGADATPAALDDAALSIVSGLAAAASRAG